jgi:anti-sigma regulatory factor (Ser/Thr protein kinase)
VLSRLHEDDLVDVLLVITELAANVYDHAQFPARLKLRRSVEPCLVNIVAEDASPASPQLQPSAADSVRGRGLIIVDQLSRRWGVARRVVGKCVWAVVPCPATP